jgi:hypothetical protein
MSKMPEIAGRRPIVIDVEAGNGVLETVYAALYGSRDAEPFALKHKRRQRRHPHPGALRAPTLPHQGRVKDCPNRHARPSA